MGLRPQTKFSLFIIESLSFKDEKAKRLEGRILRDIFLLGGHKVDYLYIRTKKELRVALKKYQRSRKRYLHISSHGTSTHVHLTLDALTIDEFGKEVNPYLKGRRLFMSACEVVNRKLAASVLPRSGCWSLIGPQKEIRFDDAVLGWSIFYHLAFKDYPRIRKLKGSKIRWYLRRVYRALGIEWAYFNHEPTAKGYKIENIHKE
jgi:hypothetical protein